MASLELFTCLESTRRGAAISRGQRTQHSARSNLCVGTNIGSLTLKLNPLRVIIILCFLFKDLFHFTRRIGFSVAAKYFCLGRIVK